MSKAMDEELVAKFRPFKHNLLVHCYPPPEETTTEGGLIIHRRGREAEIETGVRAQILAVGPGCHPDVETGQWVLLPRFGGTPITHDHLGDPDAAFKIVRDDTIICWIDEAEARRQLGLPVEKATAARR